MLRYDQTREYKEHGITAILEFAGCGVYKLFLSEHRKGVGETIWTFRTVDDVKVSSSYMATTRLVANKDAGKELRTYAHTR